VAGEVQKIGSGQSLTSDPRELFQNLPKNNFPEKKIDKKACWGDALLTKIIVTPPYSTC
jgi:hypothetical protein